MKLSPDSPPTATELTGPENRVRRLVHHFAANATRYVASTDPTDFGRQISQVVWAGHWAMEIVERKANRFLVASFKKARLTGDARLFFGLLDWDKHPRCVERITDKKMMEQVLKTFL